MTNTNPQPLDVASPEARAALASIYAHLVRLARERRAGVVQQVRDTYQPESKPPLVETTWQETQPAAGGDLASHHDHEENSP